MRFPFSLRRSVDPSAIPCRAVSRQADDLEDGRAAKRAALVRDAPACQGIFAIDSPKRHLSQAVRHDVMCAASPRGTAACLHAASSSWILCAAERAVLLQVLQETVFANIELKRRFMAIAGRVLTRQVLPVPPLRLR